jgi:energy-coupling factor transporter ATP-binding protein EcfA2
VLLCGPSGAGKSTLAAGLVQHGAQFIADDLCVLDPHGSPPALLPGRPAVRLFAEVAALIGITDAAPVPGDPRGKVIASFAATQPQTALPLGLIVLLQPEPPPEPLALRFAALRRQLFRPRWLAQLPGHAERQRAIRTLATHTPLIALPLLGLVDPATFAKRCAEMLAAIEKSAATRNPDSPSV